MTDFAKQQLLKYGWTEGKGLGKNENGIVEALKPKLKFDTTGVGHDASEYQWWEYVYNKAANNLDIGDSKNGVQVKVKDEDAVEIATSKSELNLRRIKKDHSLHFGSFIKTSTLQDGKDSINHSVFDRSENVSFPVGLNDEELFKACRGRTAHKGARHGVTCNGKLARIERQEQELLLKLQNPKEESSEWVQVESKKNKKHKKKKNEKMELEDGVDGNDDITMIHNDEEDTSKLPNILNGVEESPKIKSKKSRLKEKRKMQDLTHKLEMSLDISNDIVNSEVKKKKRKCKSQTIDSDIPEATSLPGKSKKKKRKLKNIEAEVVEGSSLELEEKIFDCKVEGPMMKKLRIDVEQSEADKLNYNTMKKKKKKLEKKTAVKLEKISEALTTLDLEKDISDNESSRAERKKKKKLEKKTAVRLGKISKALTTLDLEKDISDNEQSRAERKKKKKLEKKTAVRLGKISKSLTTLDLEKEINVDESSRAEKKKKKSKRESQD